MEAKPPPGAAARRRVDSDAYCPACGQNVRGVEVDAADVCACPECGERCTAYLLLEKQPGRRINAAQWSVAAVIGAIVAFVIGYELLSLGGLKQTAALFIGLPGLLAIVITLAPRARSATGMAVKGITIALLVSGIFLGEGIICVIMMAPIFYGIGILIGVIIDAALAVGRDRRGRVSEIRLRCWILAPLLLLSLEGVAPALSWPRGGSVTRTAVVHATPAEVAEALAAAPRFDRTLPLYLRLGFPRPVGATGEGLEVGDERVIRFEAMGAADGELRLVVSRREPQRVVFDAVADGTTISRWLRWRSAEVTWAADGGGATEVTWRLEYDRLLDPVWYFGPWQRYAVGLAADHLIETAATPRDGRDR